MFVLLPKEPQYQQKNRMFYGYEETIRLDGIVAVVTTERMRDSLVRKHDFVDVTDQCIDRKGAAKILGVPVPTVDVWTRKGLLKSYRGLFMLKQVEQLVYEREMERDEKAGD